MGSMISIKCKTGGDLCLARGGNSGVVCSDKKNAIKDDSGHLFGEKTATSDRVGNGAR